MDVNADEIRAMARQTLHENPKSLDVIIGNQQGPTGQAAWEFLTNSFVSKYEGGIRRQVSELERRGLASVLLKTLERLGRS